MSAENSLTHAGSLDTAIRSVLGSAHQGITLATSGEPSSAPTTAALHGHAVAAGEIQVCQAECVARPIARRENLDAGIDRSECCRALREKPLLIAGREQEATTDPFVPALQIGQQSAIARGKHRERLVPLIRQADRVPVQDSDDRWSASERSGIDGIPEGKSGALRVRQSSLIRHHNGA